MASNCLRLSRRRNKFYSFSAAFAANFRFGDDLMLDRVVRKGRNPPKAEIKLTQYPQPLPLFRPSLRPPNKDRLGRGRR